MHEGISPPKGSACWIQKSSCLYTVFWIHIHWFSQNKHMYDNNFPDNINIFSSPLMHVFFCPGDLLGGPWWLTPKWYLTAQWTGESWHNWAGCFPGLLPKGGHCAVPQASDFEEKALCYLTRCRQFFIWQWFLFSLRSGFPEPAVCVSEVQLCAPWLPAHLPFSQAVWPDCSPQIIHWQVHPCLLQLQVHLWWRCDEVMPDKMPALLTHHWAPFPPLISLLYQAYFSTEHLASSLLPCSVPLLNVLL